MFHLFRRTISNIESVDNWTLLLILPENSEQGTKKNRDVNNTSRFFCVIEMTMDVPGNQSFRLIPIQYSSQIISSRR